MDSEVRYPLVKPVTARQSFHSDVRQRTSKVGFPIRISADQSSFAAPHGFSQRSTSFIACAYQGIHRTPFIHSITLITNARPSNRTAHSIGPKTLGRVLEARPHTSNGMQAFRPSRAKARKRSGKNQCHTRIFRAPNPGQSPRPTARITLLFTMSANRRPSGQMPKSRKPLFLDKFFPDPALKGSRCSRRWSQPVRAQTEGRARTTKKTGWRSHEVVEPDGIEPTTSCLQSTRSPN